MGQIAQKSRGPRCDRRREAIIEVARDIFLSEGYGAASMSTIAAAVGGSKGTLYAYFRSKAELFGAVLSNTTEDLGGGQVFPAVPEPPCTHLDELTARLTRIGQTLLTFMCRPQTVALYRLVIGEAGRFPELGETFYKAGPQDKIEHLSRLLGGAMDHGLLRTDDPALAAAHFLSLCRARTHQHLLWGLAPEPSEAEIAAGARDKIAAEIDYIGKKMVEVRARGGRNDLFIADSNFGMYKDDISTCQALAKAQDDYQWPEYINVATGKNQKARVLEAARLVRGALRLSGSVQSLDEEVLRNVKRANIAADQLMLLALQSSDVDANSYSEVILGLPGDSKIAHYKTLKTIIEAGFNKVVPYTMMLLPGSEMYAAETVAKYQMDVRYRVLPRCFGSFEMGGIKFAAAEIEEVCVATNTLPYQDYLECRKLHLIVSIFYNDGVFGGLLKILRQMDVSVYRWLELLRDAQVEGPFAEVIAGFERATHEELWPDRSKLEEFIQRPGTIDRYINGELGLNLLFTYKSIAMTRHIKALADLARLTIHEALAERGLLSSKVEAFIDDILLFDCGRMSNLFDGGEGEVSATFRFDIPRFLAAKNDSDIDEFEFGGLKDMRFDLDASQRATIERGLKLFGRDDAGIGRILSKFHITRLLRRPVYSDNTAESAVANAMASTAIHKMAAPINLLDS